MNSCFSRIIPRICILIVLAHASCVQAARYVAVVTDFKSGNILAEKDCDVPVYPASLTKMMTLYLVFEALEKKEITLSQRLKMSLKASQQPPSKWGVRPNQSLSVRQCVAILSIKSANDIALGIAENLAPSAKDFVHNMNKKAKALGMHNTHFCTPSGWHDRNQKSTARDMAILLRALCIHFPKYVGCLGLRSIQKGKSTIRNTNKLLGRVSGVRLGKTGFTCPSGWNLATLTQRKTGAIISVVMGMHSSHARNQHMTHLIETFYRSPEQLQLAMNTPLAFKGSKKPAPGLGRPKFLAIQKSRGKSKHFKKQVIRLAQLKSKKSRKKSQLKRLAQGVPDKVAHLKQLPKPQIQDPVLDPVGGAIVNTVGGAIVNTVGGAILGEKQPFLTKKSKKKRVGIVLACNNPMKSKRCKYRKKKSLQRIRLKRIKGKKKQLA